MRNPFSQREQFKNDKPAANPFANASALDAPAPGTSAAPSTPGRTGADTPALKAPQRSSETAKRAAPVSRAAIAERAYANYLKTGREDGCSERNWLDAERDLANELAAESAQATAAAANEMVNEGSGSAKRPGVMTRL